ncbi:MAG: PHP domain-containing protein, partial [Cyanobacteria bacterium P01_D01_bin.44]
MLELHCHTTYSDGTLTPAQLVQLAVQRGVKALAITDHDTVGGWGGGGPRPPPPRRKKT